MSLCYYSVDYSLRYALHKRHCCAVTIVCRFEIFQKLLFAALLASRFSFCISVIKYLAYKLVHNSLIIRILVFIVFSLCS